MEKAPLFCEGIGGEKKKKSFQKFQVMLKIPQTNFIHDYFRSGCYISLKPPSFYPFHCLLECPLFDRLQDGLKGLPVQANMLTRVTVRGQCGILNSLLSKIHFHSMHDLTPRNHEWRNNLSKSEFLNERRSLSPPKAIFSGHHMRELTNIPGIFPFLYYVCRHCTPH